MKVYQLIAELQQLEKSGFGGATIRGPRKSTMSTSVDYNQWQPMIDYATIETQKDKSVVLFFENCMGE